MKIEGSKVTLENFGVKMWFWKILVSN